MTEKLPRRKFLESILGGTVLLTGCAGPSLQDLPVSQGSEDEIKDVSCALEAILKKSKMPGGVKDTDRFQVWGENISADEVFSRAEFLFPVDYREKNAFKERQLQCFATVASHAVEKGAGDFLVKLVKATPELADGPIVLEDKTSYTLLDDIATHYPKTVPHDKSRAEVLKEVNTLRREYNAQFDDGMSNVIREQIQKRSPVTPPLNRNIDPVFTPKNNSRERT